MKSVLYYFECNEHFQYDAQPYSEVAPHANFVISLLCIIFSEMHTEMPITSQVLPQFIIQHMKENRLANSDVFSYPSHSE